MSIEVIGPDGASTMFPEGTPTSVMQAAMARVYGGPPTAGATLAQLSDPEATEPSSAPAGGQSASAAQDQPDPAAGAAPNLALASLPPGGGYAPFADAARDAAEPWLDALAADPSPVWNARLGLFSQTKPMRDAAGVVAGALQDGGVSPALAGLVADPLTGGWRPPESLDEAGGRPPSAATWLGLYHTLPSLLQTDPWTGQALPDADSPVNANIASIAGHLRRGFIGDPLTGEGGAIPGYGQVHTFIGDPFSIRAAHDGMDGTLFAEDPSGFNAAWLKAQTPAEQAAPAPPSPARSRTASRAARSSQASSARRTRRRGWRPCSGRTRLRPSPPRARPPSTRGWRRCGTTRRRRCPPPRRTAVDRAGSSPPALRAYQPVAVGRPSTRPHSPLPRSVQTTEQRLA